MKTCAIIGDVLNPAKWANKSFRAHKMAGFQVFPVHPSGGELDGVPVFPSLAEIPERLDRISVYLRPSLVMEDTSRSLPKRITWLLNNQRRVVAPDWETSATCLSAGLCVGMVPVHFARPRIDRGEWVALTLENPFPDAACCLTWQQNDMSPALEWLLAYLGDSETLNREWLKEPE